MRLKYVNSYRFWVLWLHLVKVSMSAKYLVKFSFISERKNWTKAMETVMKSL